MDGGARRGRQNFRSRGSLTGGARTGAHAATLRYRKYRPRRTNLEVLTMQAMEMKHWVAFACVGIAAGSTFMWTKLALQELLPVQLLALRFLLAMVLLSGIALVRRPAWPAQG